MVGQKAAGVIAQRFDIDALIRQTAAQGVGDELLIETGRQLTVIPHENSAYQVQKWVR